MPTRPERRERLFQDLVRAERKPVVLFIDEAHDLHGHTLNGLKRLMEVIDEGGGMLSVVMTGHPRLHNDLRRPTMEEIGHRTTKFEFNSIADERREFPRLAARAVPRRWRGAGCRDRRGGPGGYLAERL